MGSAIRSQQKSSPPEPALDLHGKYPKSHISRVQPEPVRRGLGGQQEHTQGRRLLSPDPGVLSGSGLSCSLQFVPAEAEKPLGSLGLGKASQRLQHSLLEHSPASLEGGTHTTPHSGDLYQGQLIFRAK